MNKPKPIPVVIECSLCGLPWDDHGENPTAETCIALLRAELAARPVTPAPIIIQPQPYWQRTGDWWQYPTIISSSNSSTLSLVGESGPERILPTRRDDDDPPGVMAVVS